MTGDYRGEQQYNRGRQSRDTRDSRDHGRYSGGRDHERGGRGRGSDYEQDRRGIPLSQLDPVTTEASRKAIGVAIEVHKALGPGYDRDVYLAAILFELDALGVEYKQNYSMPIEYKGKVIGKTTATLFVNNRFVLDVMSKPEEITSHERLVMRAQLKAASVDLGLIINFGERRLKDGLVRVVNIEKLTKEKGLMFDEQQEYDDSRPRSSRREEGPELADFN